MQSDLINDIKVDKNSVYEYCSKINYQYFDVSAKDGLGFGKLEGAITKILRSEIHLKRMKEIKKKVNIKIK